MTELSRPLICVIEDDRFVRESLVALVECDGYDAQSFADAESFLKADAVPQASFLVVDVRLPGMNGIELLEQLRRRDSSRPTVIVTGHADSADLQHLPEVECVAFLSKPADPQKLLDIISSALSEDTVEDA